MNDIKNEQEEFWLVNLVMNILIGIKTISYWQQIKCLQNFF